MQINIFLKQIGLSCSLSASTSSHLMEATGMSRSLMSFQSLNLLLSFLLLGKEDSWRFALVFHNYLFLMATNELLVIFDMFFFGVEKKDTGFRNPILLLIKIILEWKLHLQGLLQFLLKSDVQQFWMKTWVFQEKCNTFCCNFVGQLRGRIEVWRKHLSKRSWVFLSWSI